MNQLTSNSTGVESQERLLFNYLQHLDKRKTGKRAVHIHLSKLQPHNRRDHHIRLAADTFSQMVKMRKGQLFILKNLDLFFTYNGESHNDVETSIFKLLYLFSDDQLLKTEDKISQSNFRTFFNVERDFEEMLGLVRSMAHADNQKTNKNQEFKLRSTRKVKPSLTKKRNANRTNEKHITNYEGKPLKRFDLGNPLIIKWKVPN